MKKCFYKSTVVLLVIAFLIPFFASCGESDVTEDKELIDIIKDGKSEYVLVSNPSDSIAEYASTAVWNLLYDAYGVSLKKVSDTVQSDYEIIIGNAAREGVAEIREKCNGKDDFAICQSGNRLYLYAETFTGAKKLVLALRDHFLPAGTDGILSFEKELLVLGHEQSASVFSGEAVELIKNGKSDYTIVCNSQNQKDLSVAHYLSRSIQLVCGNKPNVIDYQRSDVEYEIVLGTGTLKHDAYATVRRSLKGSGQYVFAVSGKKLIITATDEKSLLDAVEYLVVNYLSAVKNGDCVVYECEEVRSQFDRNGFSMSEERMRELYADVLNLYPTLYQMYYRNNVTGISKSDQEMIDILIERMGKSIVLRNGSSSILYDGMIRKLDKSDYGRIAKLSPAASTVPAAFVNAYFGTSYSEDQEIDLRTARSKPVIPMITML